MSSFPVSNGLKPQTPHWDLTPSEKGSPSRLRWGVRALVGGHTRGQNFLCHAHCRGREVSNKPFPKHGSVNRLSRSCAGCFAGDKSDTPEKNRWRRIKEQTKQQTTSAAQEDKRTSTVPAVCCWLCKAAWWTRGT